MQALVDVWFTMILQAWLQNDTVLSGCNVHVTVIISDNGTSEKGHGTTQPSVTGKYNENSLELGLLLHYI